MLMTLYVAEGLPYRPCSDDFQWDLGEFNQKGAVATRWGSKEELVHAVAVAKRRGIDVIIDAVVNVCHADSTVVRLRTDPNRSIRSAQIRGKSLWRPQ